MAWRILLTADHTWTVSVAAERCSGSNDWTLVAGFRTSAPEPKRFWIVLPVRSPSKAQLFAEADTISNEILLDALQSRLAL
ncbi:MAG: hypothetical protein ABIZ70_09520 [Gemmatimonadales bacterium]